jgi:hypothetical protein
LTSLEILILDIISGFKSLAIFLPRSELHASSEHGFQGGLELSQWDSDHLARWQPDLDSDHNHSDASLACFAALVSLSQGRKSAFVDVYPAGAEWLWEDSIPHIGIFKFYLPPNPRY